MCSTTQNTPKIFICPQHKNHISSKWIWWVKIADRFVVFYATTNKYSEGWHVKICLCHAANWYAAKDLSVRCCRWLNVPEHYTRTPELDDDDPSKLVGWNVLDRFIVRHHQWSVAFCIYTAGDKRQARTTQFDAFYTFSSADGLRENI